MLTAIQYDQASLETMKNDLLKLQQSEQGIEAICNHLRDKYEHYPEVPLLLAIHYVFMHEDVDSQIVKNFIEHVLHINITDYVSIISKEHIVYVLVHENERFRALLKLLRTQLETWRGVKETDEQQRIKETVHALGQIHNHFHVKEKLIFPVIERYGHIQFTRDMWREDDYIRSTYKAVKNLLADKVRTDSDDIHRTVQLFSEKLKHMLIQEEYMLFPLTLQLFEESEWKQIKIESSAYGYDDNHSEDNDKTETLTANGKSDKTPKSLTNEDMERRKTENIPFGKGYLTLEEADLILNNLPVEITFVDRNSIFKYFNDIHAAQDTILIRTPLSIGRNVAHCHPPKSLRKVMTLVRDLKTKKRTTETMWFKKGDAYVHITYKGLFNEEGEFIGILEYVQDIAPFLQLPTEEKTSIKKTVDMKQICH